MLKKGLYLLLVFLVALSFYFREDLQYGLNQAAGQAEVLWNAVDIEQVKQNPNTPDTVLKKIEFIEQVKKYGFEKLALNDSENYTSFYDQKGEPILWVLTASPAFEIKAYQWEFPVAGTFPYKGFFELEKLKKEDTRMQEMGYDTDIDEVSAWSTLGWFRDPILSSMLSRSEGKLAELILHELSHASIYLKNQGEYNENLANFIGKEGAKSFLRDQYPLDSSFLVQYKSQLERSKTFARFMFNERKKLDSVYRNLSPEWSEEKKQNIKAMALEQIRQHLMDSLLRESDSKRRAYWENFEFNNAFFTGFETYSSKQDSLQLLLNKTYSGDLKRMIIELKKQSESH